jgi:hypothetical protein
VSACPLCGDDANVQKVTGIYRSRGVGQHDDDLSALLAPPRQEPAAASTPAAPAAPPASGGSLDDPGAIAGYGGALAVVGGAVGWFWSPDELSPMTYAWVGIMTGLVVGVVVGIVYGALRGPRAAPMMGTSTASATSGEGNGHSAAYRQRLDRWEQAYYCRKHDVVILPDESKALSPTAFRSLMDGGTERPAPSP